MKQHVGAGIAAAAFATIVWGIQLPLAKDAFIAVDPYHITSTRYLFAAACLSVVLLLREGPGAFSYRGRGQTAIWLGIVGMCGSPLLVFVGMSLSRAEHAVVIVTMQPLMAAVAMWVLRGARPGRVTIACLLAAFAGVVMVVTKGDLTMVESPRQLLGDAIVFFGAGAWVVYTLGLGRLAGWSIWRTTVLTMIPGALASSAVTAAMVMAGVIVFPSTAAIASVGWELAFLVFFGVVLSMLAWNYGTRHIGPLNSTLFINCMPVTTFVYRSLQGQSFEPIEIVGAGLVIGALIANNLHLRQVRRRAALAAAAA